MYIKVEISTPTWADFFEIDIFRVYVQYELAANTLHWMPLHITYYHILLQTFQLLTKYFSTKKKDFIYQGIATQTTC